MKSIGEISAFISDGDWIESKDQSESGIRLLQVGNIGLSEFIPKDERAKYISEETYAKLNCTEIFPGDILISRLPEPVGRACIVPEGLGRCITAVDCTILRLNESECDKRYFINYTQSPTYFFKLKRFLTGTTRIRISRKNLESVEIPLPPLDVQRRIAETLDKVTELISLRKTQLEKLDELVKARFVEMFGNPVSNERGWEQVPLSICIASIDNGKSFICDSVSRKGDWPAVLKLSAATYGFYRPEENKALLDEKQFVDDAAVEAGDLLFTRKNTPELVGMCAYVYTTPTKLMMPDLIFRLNTTERCNKIFLWKLINHDIFRDCIQQIATGSAKSMSNISKERLLGLEIILPPIKLQTQFASFVSSVEETKAPIQQSLDTLETLKKSLMQEYFGLGPETAGAPGGAVSGA